MHFIAAWKAVSFRKSEGKRHQILRTIKSAHVLLSYKTFPTVRLVRRVLCEEPGWAQAVLTSTAMHLCIPQAPWKHTLCLPAFLPRVHGNKPVLCPLMIKCAIRFWLIGCVFIRWSPDRQFGVAQWLLWFGVYKLVWEVANIGLPP